MNLTANMQIAEVGAPVSNSTSTDQNSDRLDMSGWDGVVFFVPITDCADTGVALLTVQQNTIDSDSGMASLVATATATSASNDDLNGKLLIVNVYRPKERYVQGTITSATANIAFGNTMAIRYRGKVAPITDHASVSASTIAVEPAEA